jgi:hypothetical protein
MIVNVLGLDMLGHVVLLLAEVQADGALVLSCRKPGCPPPQYPHLASKSHAPFFWLCLRNRIPDRIEYIKVRRLRISEYHSDLLMKKEKQAWPGQSLSVGQDFQKKNNNKQ